MKNISEIVNEPECIILIDFFKQSRLDISKMNLIEYLADIIKFFPPLCPINANAICLDFKNRRNYLLQNCCINCDYFTYWNDTCKKDHNFKQFRCFADKICNTFKIQKIDNTEYYYRKDEFDDRDII